MKTRGKIGVFGRVFAAVATMLGISQKSANTRVPIHTDIYGGKEFLDIPAPVHTTAPRMRGYSYKPRDLTRIPKGYKLKTARIPFNGTYGRWLLDHLREQNIREYSDRFTQEAQ